MFNVPILLILYDRIEETHKVFQVLRNIQPAKLYVAGDAAKSGNDLDYKRVYQARSVVQPNWDCQLHTLWQDQHLGKSTAIYESIKWFFTQEEEGIILFEDTLPSLDFFTYCEELLDKYRDNSDIYTIGGSYLRRHSKKRYNKRMRKNKSSYYFSAYATTWGFATWRNRWEDFSLSMSSYNMEDFSRIVTPYMRDQNQRLYWISRFNIIKKYNATYWDYQINLHVWAHHGLCISPFSNLVTNIGFKKQRRKIRRRLRRNFYPILPLNHPSETIQNHKDDRYMFKHIYNRAYLYLFKDWLKGILPSKQEEF